MTCTFSRFDPPPVAYQEFSSVFEIWLGQLIDDLNALIENLETCLPVKFVGKFNYGGGSTSVVIPVSGVTASQLAQVQIIESTNLVSVQKVITSTDTITVTLSGDPGANTVLSYLVLKV